MLYAPFASYSSSTSHIIRLFLFVLLLNLIIRNQHQFLRRAEMNDCLLLQICFNFFFHLFPAVLSFSLPCLFAGIHSGFSIYLNINAFLIIPSVVRDGDEEKNVDLNEKSPFRRFSWWILVTSILTAHHWTNGFSGKIRI